MPTFRLKKTVTPTKKKSSFLDALDHQIDRLKDPTVLSPNRGQETSRKTIPQDLEGRKGGRREPDYQVRARGEIVERKISPELSQEEVELRTKLARKEQRKHKEAITEIAGEISNNSSDENRGIVDGENSKERHKEEGRGKKGESRHLSKQAEPLLSGKSRESEKRDQKGNLVEEEQDNRHSKEERQSLLRTSPNSGNEPSITISAERRGKLEIFGENAVDLPKLRLKRGQIPGRICDKCYLAGDCPGYKEGAVCAYSEAFSVFPTRDAVEVLEAMRTIVSDNMERLEFSKHAEKFGAAGQLDPNVTRLSEVVLSQQSQLLELNSELQKVTVSVQGEGTNKGVGGVLSQLFGVGKPEINNSLLLQSNDVQKELDLEKSAGLDPLEKEPESLQNDSIIIPSNEGDSTDISNPELLLDLAKNAESTSQ